MENLRTQCLKRMKHYMIYETYSKETKQTHMQCTDLALQMVTVEILPPGTASNHV